MEPAEPRNFPSIRSLVESYRERFPVVSRYETVVKLIDNYNASDLYERIEKRNKERTRMVRSIVDVYSHSDLFKEAGRYDLGADTVISQKNLSWFNFLWTITLELCKV